MPISSSAPSSPYISPLHLKHCGGEGSKRGRRGRAKEGNSSNGGAADQDPRRPDATMLLLRRAAADDGSGAGVGRPRLFAVPRLMVGLGAPSCGAATTAARSMTSPLHLRAPFAALGGSLHRSPRSPRTRSWDSHRLSDLVVHDDDAVLAEPAATGASNCLLGVGSVSATAVEVQQSEDCTCIIIAHGSNSNPKITPIFADRGIPEPCCTVIVI